MTDPERVDVYEQLDWANDCSELETLAAMAEKNVRRENFDQAHELLNKLRHKVDEVSEEYPRYIHE